MDALSDLPSADGQLQLIPHPGRYGSAALVSSKSALVMNGEVISKWQKECSQGYGRDVRPIRGLRHLATDICQPSTNSTVGIDMFVPCTFLVYRKLLHLLGLPEWHVWNQEGGLIQGAWKLPYLPNAGRPEECLAVNAKRAFVEQTAWKTAETAGENDRWASAWHGTT